LKNQGFNTATNSPGFSQSVEILASGATGGMLQAGESETVSIYYGGWLSNKWDFSNPGVTFSLAVVTPSDTATIDWASMKSSLQPGGISNAGWEAIYPNLTAQLGSTWGAYVQTLDQVAAYLGSLGENVTNLSQLFSLEIQEANGTNPVPQLSTATDMTLQVPGLPLSIGRSFSSTITGRNVLGPFGNGWAWQGGWGTTLAVQGDGSVVLAYPDGSQEVFTLQPSGSFLAQPGDYNTLANLGSGVYTLNSRDGQVTQLVNGQMAYIQDADGNRITAGYTGGLLTSLTDSSGQWIDLSYNASGRITTLTNSLGQTANYTYDANNLYLLSVTNYDGYTTNYTYNTSSGSAGSNALLTIANPDGTVQDFSYDAEGRLSQASLGGAQAIQYSYGSGGAVTATDADGNATTYSYDYRGLVAQVVDPLGHTVLYTYDNNGDLLAVTDPAGQASTYQYNSQGEMTQSVNTDSAVTKFTYGPLDTLTSVQDPNSNITQYKYDANGDLLSTLYADGTVESNAYNPIGELLQSTDGDGNVINNTYNAAGQLLSKTYSDGSQVDYTYDSFANLTSVIDSTGTTTLTYDSANRLTGVLYPDGTYLMYSYNSAGQRTQMVDQTGYAVNYSYNTLGQLTGLTDGSGNSIVS